MSITMNRNRDYEAEDRGDVADVLGAPDLTPEELAAEWAADSAPPSGPLANLASSLVAAGVGAAGMVIALGLGLGSVNEPRAGTWPFIIGLIITVLALAQLFIGRRGGVDGEKFSPLSRMAGFGFLTLLGLVWLMPVIGFEIPSLLLCFVWMKFLGGETWRAATLYSVLVVISFYAIFILGLGTSIPHLF
ncbi:MAG: tripartite tricarboxylate transporter TctB family protein [Actinomycetes bacterium]